MDIKRFLTEAYPPSAEWRPYPILRKNEESWAPGHTLSMYELIGKILVARDNVPNPCFTSHPYHVQQASIMDDIEKDDHFKTWYRLHNDCMPPLNNADMCKLIEIINRYQVSILNYN